MQPVFRPGTWDALIWQQVAERNEYRLPQYVGGLVIDVGAHIGSFSHACLTRGARAVVAIEASRANYGLCVHNLAWAGDRASVIHGAAWAAGAATALCWAPSTDPQNTGGGGINAWTGTETVQSVDLDVLLVTRGRCDLLKLDCEGCEYPVLFSSQQLDRVREICGEYHPRPEGEQTLGHAHTIQALRHHLGTHGFAVTHEPTAHGFGHFWALRGDR